MYQKFQSQKQGQLVINVGVEQAERSLASGVAIVGPAAAAIAGELGRRGAAIRELVTDLTWAESKNGRVYATRAATMTGVLLVLFPDADLPYLGSTQAFQTFPHADGTIRVNVRRVGMTDIWAGLGLFHELSHVFDFQSGIEPRIPTRAQFLDGEVRAYQLEMAMLDELTSGRLTSGLAELVDGPLDPQWLLTSGWELSAQLQAITAVPGEEPPASESERFMRDGFYRVALLMASLWDGNGPATVDDPYVASHGLGQLLSAAL